VKGPIVEEVRRARKKIEADHGNDCDRPTRYPIERQAASSAKVVSYPPKKLPHRATA
jgi:hypothetical protein